MTKDEWVSALLRIGFKQREDGVFERFGVEIEHTPGPCSCAAESSGMYDYCCPHGEWSAAVGTSMFIGSDTPIDALRAAIGDAANEVRSAERVFFEDFAKLGLRVVKVTDDGGDTVKFDAEQFEGAMVTDLKWGKRKPGIGGRLTRVYGSTSTPFDSRRWSILTRDTPDEVWAKVVAATTP